MSANIDIKIGCDGSEKEQMYSAVEIRFILEEKKLAKLGQQLRKKSGRGTTPFLLIQLPTLDFEGIEVPTFNKKQTFIHGQRNHGNKIVHWGNLKQQKTNTLMKKVQKAFHKVSALQNQCWINLNFYDIDHIQKTMEEENSNVNAKIAKALLNKFQVKGQLKTDAMLISVLKDIFNQVSPSFNQSPIMVILQLFQSLDLQLSFNQIETLSDNNLQMLFGSLKYLRDPDDRITTKLRQCKQTFNMYMTFPGIACLHMKVSSRLLGLLASLL